MQSEASQVKKLLLMGRSGAGKTSMHSIIFANYPAKDTTNIGFTVDVAESKFRFMGNLTLNLWDCGGQDRLMKHYLTSQKDTIFKNVAVLIYVFDVESSELEEDMRDYKACIQNLANYSKNAYVFVLIHKMDRINEGDRKKVFEKKKNELTDSTQGITIKEIFGTSIWDDTLYKAWSQIVQLLIPNMPFIKETLKNFCGIWDCDEIVLFEKQTFLIIAYHDNRPNKDIVKYERLSTIVKQFKLSCSKIGTQIGSMMVRNTKFTGFIQQFTENTYILIVVSDPRIQPAAIELNIDSARKFFAREKNGEIDNPLANWKV
jgi:Ras-related GTP-binding protein A/B